MKGNKFIENSIKQKWCILTQVLNSSLVFLLQIVQILPSRFTKEGSGTMWSIKNREMKKKNMKKFSVNLMDWKITKMKEL